MSLKADGIFTKVICDGCGAEHHTTCTLPVLAYYDATIHHGWTPGGDLDPRRAGVHCPNCTKEDA